MCNQCQQSFTLVKGNCFVWCRDTCGSITIRSACGEGIRATFTVEQYRAVLDLLSSNPEGTQLGACATGTEAMGSLGRLMSTFGKSRSQASLIAAIAADEGYVEADYRGSHGGGLWLLPAQEGRDPGNYVVMDLADDLANSKTQPTWETNALWPDIDGTITRLQLLADRVSRTEAVDNSSWSFDLADVTEASAEKVLGQISAWEREVESAKYVYRFRVENAVLASRCRDGLAIAKSRNVGGRRFARLNGDCEDSACLYVGSSRALVSRVRQHLGLAHRGTYALQIGHWRAEKPLQGTLHLEVTRFAPSTDDIVLQTLEDSLWLAERPRFGRMGAR